MDITSYSPQKRDYIQKIVEEELYDYVTDINRRWNSNIFPSSSLAKAILKNLHEGRNNYRKYHTLVKKVLSKWSTLGFCKLISMTSLPSGKKTKYIYQFEFDKMKRFQVIKLLPLSI
jgi:hypothetical protein